MLADSNYSKLFVQRHAGVVSLVSQSSGDKGALCTSSCSSKWIKDTCANAHVFSPPKSQKHFYQGCNCSCFPEKTSLKAWRIQEKNRILGSLAYFTSHQCKKEGMLLRLSLVINVFTLIQFVIQNKCCLVFGQPTLKRYNCVRPENVKPWLLLHEKKSKRLNTFHSSYHVTWCVYWDPRYSVLETICGLLCSVTSTMVRVSSLKAKQI